MCQDLTNL